MRIAFISSIMLFMLLAVPPASATTYSFAFDNSVAITGNDVTASGSLTTTYQGIDSSGFSIEDIVSASGTINGSAITGLDPDPTIANVVSGSNIFPDPLVDVGFTTASGTSYHFYLDTFSSSVGDTGFGTFALTVPLPSSAPLFGVALSMLGLTGYRLKRRHASLT